MFVWAICVWGICVWLTSLCLFELALFVWACFVFFLNLLFCLSLIFVWSNCVLTELTSFDWTCFVWLRLLWLVDFAGFAEVCFGLLRLLQPGLLGGAEQNFLSNWFGLALGIHLTCALSMLQCIMSVFCLPSTCIQSVLLSCSPSPGQYLPANFDLVQRLSHQHALAQPTQQAQRLQLAQLIQLAQAWYAGKGSSTSRNPCRALFKKHEAPTQESLQRTPLSHQGDSPLKFRV